MCERFLFLVVSRRLGMPSQTRPDDSGSRLRKGWSWKNPSMCQTLFLRPRRFRDLFPFLKRNRELLAMSDQELDFPQVVTGTKVEHTSQLEEQ